MQSAHLRRLYQVAQRHSVARLRQLRDRLCHQVAADQHMIVAIKPLFGQQRRLIYVTQHRIIRWPTIDAVYAVPLTPSEHQLYLNDIPVSDHCKMELTVQVKIRWQPQNGTLVFGTCRRAIYGNQLQAILAKQLATTNRSVLLKVFNGEESVLTNQIVASLDFWLSALHARVEAAHFTYVLYDNQPEVSSQTVTRFYSNMQKEVA